MKGYRNGVLGGGGGPFFDPSFPACLPAMLVRRLLDAWYFSVEFGRGFVRTGGFAAGVLGRWLRQAPPSADERSSRLSRTGPRTAPEGPPRYVDLPQTVFPAANAAPRMLL